MRVLIMGGGLAGLSAAVYLVDHGFQVTLIEAEEILGGRASSWRDEDGDNIDNALHVFFPHYINVLDFFSHIGARDVIRWTDTLTYFKEGGEAAHFRAWELPAPLHGLSLFKFSHVGWWDLARFGPAAMHALSMSEKSLWGYDAITVEDFLHRYGVSQRLIDNMLRAMVNGLTFLEPHEVSARTMAYWIRNLTTTAEAVKVGFAKGGLGEIYVNKAVKYVTSRGGKIITGKGVKSINVENDKVKNISPHQGRNMRGDIYISALPFQALRKLLPSRAFDYQYFANLWRFEEAPSLSAQLWFDRKVLRLRNISTGIGTVFNWFADLTQIVPEAFPHKGSVLEMVITPCKHLLSLPDEAIYAQVLRDLHRILPGSKEAQVLKWKIVRERQGVFAQKPNLDRYRPPQRTPLSNLYLVGDFTRAGHSAGMEGAVVSGKLAAMTILKDKRGVMVDLVKKADFGQGLIPLFKYGQPLMLMLLLSRTIKKKTWIKKAKGTY